MASSIRIGSRRSALALAQARLVADALGGAEIVEVGNDAAQSAGGDKARFVRGVERALLDDEVDLGVHSAKDLPSELPPELRLSGVPAREDPLDAYVGAETSLDDVPEGARIGTSSLRRRAQLLAVRPDLDVVELRGNVDTRLRRLADGDFEGVVLASAGLRRLAREGEIGFAFDAAVMTPAPGQGSLALETRREDEDSAAAAARISDATALVELTVERAAVAELDATCRTPVGVHAALADGRLRVEGFVGLPDGSEWVRDALEADPEDPVSAGRELAERMAAAGARDVLERAERVA
ncbi:MAG TPA: hydroxymethylbilane synthase [Solirubrobacterales bacterium]|nr:hydroxymethylbilane synthase [Solirubrobacterales bacterium]